MKTTECAPNAETMSTVAGAGTTDDSDLDDSAATPKQQLAQRIEKGTPKFENSYDLTQGFLGR